MGLFISGRQRREIAFFWGLLAAGLFMMFSPSRPFWEAVPPLRYVQFPWRWLAVCTFSLAYLGAAGLGALLKEGAKKRELGGLALAGSLVLLAPSVATAWGTRGYSATTLPLAALTLAIGGALYLATRRGVSIHWAGKGLTSLICLGMCALFFFEQGEQGLMPINVPARQLTLSGWLNWERKSGFVGTTIQGEYLPAAVKRQALPPPDERLHPSAGDGVAIGKIRFSSAGAEAVVTAPARWTLVYEQFYFPGWCAWIDGQPAQIKATSEGLMSLALPQGKHRVEFRFGFTGVRLGATLASYLALAAAVFLAVFWRPRRRFTH
jgi:hypothetical protein